MFGVGIGHNAKRRIEPQLFFQRLAEIITLATELVILRFQCRQLRPLLLLHLDVLIKLSAQLATLPLQACELLGKPGELEAGRNSRRIFQRHAWIITRPLLRPRDVVADFIVACVVAHLRFVRCARAILGRRALHVTTCWRYIARTGTEQPCKRCLEDRALGAPVGHDPLDKRRGC